MVFLFCVLNAYIYKKKNTVPLTSHTILLTITAREQEGPQHKGILL